MRIIASTIVQSHRHLSRLPKQIPPALMNRPQFHFSENSALLLDKGSLQFRNSETYELKVVKYNPSDNTTELVSLQFTNKSTINDMADQFKTRFGIENLNVYCEDGTVVSKWAPVQALLNRIFMIVSEDYRIRVEGQFLHSDIDAARSHKIYELKENLSQLELPVLAQRQIESYINRVNIWLDAKYGSENKNPTLRIKSKDIQDILVQSILDPQCKWRSIASLEQQWIEKYWEIVELREKKQKAIELSQKMAKRKMLYGMGLLAANIGFIWSGTYVFFSWDIVEPMAYFSSSLAGIILFGQVLKLRKPFSLQNYKQYLANSYLQQACKRVDLNLSDLNSRQAQLQDIESILKDYLIVKL